MSDDMTPAEAVELVNADKQRRVTACLRDVQDVLEKHACDLVAEPIYTPDGRTVCKINFVAR